MRGHLDELARAFKGLAEARGRQLTSENKAGTLQPSTEADVMTALLGTLPFIATLWLLVVLGAAVLEESGAKIAAALKGEPLRRPASPLVGRRIRVRLQSQEVRRANAPLRAAA
jgi:hypothetical protein